MIEILSRWNRWGSADLSAVIARDITAELLPFLNSPEAVTLIGPRRAGKTTVMFQVMDILEQAGVKREAMLHVNLEEPAISPQLNPDLLDQIYNTYREEVFPQGKAYLFLDEIQNVPGWERWVRARNESENIKLFITGSSSQLMSRELATLLTGRHVSFKVFPLSFNEFLRFKAVKIPKIMKISAPPAIQHALNAYLRWGGFPEVVLATDERRKELLLKQYFDDILFKDVAMRHPVRDVITLRNLGVHLLTQTGNLISLQRIAKIFGVSLDLAKAYCQYLQEAFVIDFVPFYSRKTAERVRHPQKVHVIDLGLRHAVSLSDSEDKGHIIETAVYQELLRRPNDGIFYWKRNTEMDLMVRRGNQIRSLLQIVYEGIDRLEIQQRELQVFNEAKEVFANAQKYIIVGKLPKTGFEIDLDVEMLPLWYFLLHNQDK